MLVQLGLPVSWPAGWLLLDPDLLGVVLQVLLVVLDPVEPVAERPRLSSVVSSTVWLWVQLEPG
jgi:hypothetical protein